MPPDTPTHTPTNTPIPTQESPAGQKIGNGVATAADVVLVTRDDAVMCLNYVARVGECLYAGDTDDIGKAPCREAGTPTRGLFRVLAVLAGTVSAADCPAGILHTLVHRADREVVCLGLP